MEHDQMDMTTGKSRLRIKKYSFDLDFKDLKKLWKMLKRPKNKEIRLCCNLLYN